MGRQLSRRSRVLVAVVGGLLAMIYLVPIWTIHLTAPQYPEGLGMHIWVNTITGISEFDVRNINLLNHYIGMEPIVETSIPELRYMPFGLALMIIGAFTTLLLNRLMLVWVGLVNWLAVGVAGMWDFWRWGYNYGHNLHPDAPISIPGMSYQPPLIGCKQLLNITSCSWPGIGGMLLLCVGVLLTVTLMLEYRKTSYAATGR